jgi:polyisoprenoid-binding protein YceI
MSLYIKHIATSILILFFISGKAQQADTLVFIMDTTESYVAWNCDSHHGTVPLQSGIIKIADGEIVSGNFKLKMDSIKDLDIDYPLMRHTLENTLRSEFFFDVEHYPVADFNIDYTIPAEKNKVLIAGDLWIRGLVNCIDFESKIVYDQQQFTAVSDSFKINRINWNITIYSKQEAKSEEAVIVSDDIGFVIHLKGYKKENPENR